MKPLTGNLKKDLPVLKRLTVLFPGKRLRDYGETREARQSTIHAALSQVH